MVTGSQIFLHNLHGAVLRTATISAKRAEMILHKIGGLLATAVAMTLALLFWSLTKLPLHKETPVPSFRIKLAQSLNDRRPPEGRVVGFAYVQAAVKPFSKEQRKSLLEFFKEARERLEKKRDAWNLADLAVLELMAGDCYKAVNLLESATTMSPHDERLLSDLAAAYLSRSLRRRSIHDVMRGLEAAQKALILNPRLPEAWFNQGIALEILHIKPEARLSWDQYLSLDHHSPWEREVAIRRRRLEEPEEVLSWRKAQHDLVLASAQRNENMVKELVERFSQPLQVYAAEVLLSDWASAATSDQIKEEQVGQTLSMIGLALARFNGDYEITDAAAGLDRVRLNKDSKRLLVRGYNLFALGRKLQLTYRPSESIPFLSEAYENLSKVGSPIAYWARLYQAVALIELRREAPALDIISGLTEAVDKERYPSLGGKIDWIYGMLLFRDSQPIRALDYFLSAIDKYKKISAWEDLCASHYLAAETLEYLGNSEGASEHLWESLALSDRLINSRRVFSIFDELADSAHEEGEPEVAIRFRNVVVERARTARDIFGLVHALRRRAETLVVLRRLPEALADLSRADELADKIEDSAERLEAEALIDLARGKSLVFREPRESLSLLQRAANFYVAKPDQFELPQLYLAQYHALEALGDNTESAYVVEQGIKWYESQAPAMSDVDFSAAFSARAGQLFSIAVESAILRMDYLGALRYGERQRLGSLAVLQNKAQFLQLSEEASKISFKSIQASVPRDVLVIVYLPGSSATVVWSIDAYRSKTFNLQLSGDELAGLVESYYRSVDDRFELTTRRKILGKLYDKMVAPVLLCHRGIKKIVVVPSGVATSIPFSAAFDRNSGRYLIESYSVAVSPSILGAQAFLRSDRDSFVRLNNVIVVGNPTLDRHVLPHLPSLPLAAAEARKIRALYERGELLVGGQATKEFVLQEIRKFPVVHIAAHALANRRFPGRSLIALSPGSSGDGGLVYPRDIVDLDLSSVKLLVLSSCHGASDEQHRTAGSMNLVIPFLASGVDLVVASLWDVPDSVGFNLLPLLHREIRRGYEPSEALRRAQLELLHSGDDVLADPMSWASFGVFVS